LSIAPLTFTVFTPTYNRARTLSRVFESLKNQTFQNFEWLIIDDGSNDETRDLVERWSNDPTVYFPIRYIWQENAHKKVAHNKAVEIARGILFMVFDSDDRCLPSALERLWHHWNAIPTSQQEFFFGVCGLCMDESGKTIGNQFPTRSFIDSDALEIRYRYGVHGEKWGAMRTDILKAYRFREDIPGLVPEGTVWDAIARQYKTRFFNEALRIYTQDTSGLIARKGEVVDASKNAAGALFAKKLVLDYNVAYLRYAPKEFFLEAARLNRFWLHCSKELRQKIGYWPNSGAGKVLVLVFSPVGIFMWLRDRWLWGRYQRKERKL
jgi:glycosyltransferase involved in cell wall biosynthesis